MDRERRTVRAMIGLFCRRFHAPEAGSGFCPSCAGLLQYALARIERCPHGEDKPACSRCRIHCFRTEEREGIRRVMRYAGPRMLLVHPLLALAHLARLRRR